MPTELTKRTISVIPVTRFPLVRPETNLPALIARHLNEYDSGIEEGDILVVTHSIVSVAESSIHEVRKVEPTEKAKKIAELNDQSPFRVEVALREAIEIISETPVLLTTTRHGLKTDYSGVDESNAPEGFLVALPADPDASARSISEQVSALVGFRVPVIVTDTQGRPWRKGAVNLAIGSAGLKPIVDNSGRRDIYGRILRSSSVCLVDEIASAAELVMGQAGEGVPIAIVRGFEFERGVGSASEIVRDSDENLFG